MGTTTRFEEGQPVRATETAQGMKKGQLYRVLEVSERPTFAGTFVQYRIQAEGEAPIWVVNGHILLAEVDTSSVGAILGLWSEGGSRSRGRQGRR
jgi:hypothetical protein